MNKPLIKVITGGQASRQERAHSTADRPTHRGRCPGREHSEHQHGIVGVRGARRTIGSSTTMSAATCQTPRSPTCSWMRCRTSFEWERAIASVLAEGLADVTISGSNARLLSSDLATRLTGRYVEIPVYPLLFSEFIRFQGIEPELTRCSGGLDQLPALWRIPGHSLLESGG